ncbi:hypothetical protein [Actinophytocola sp. KF-1]
MLAILAAVLFAIALIMDLADATIGISASVFVTGGLLCLALHMAGIGAALPARNGRRWSMRR